MTWETDAAAVPTNERLKNFNKINDPGFVTLYFQYGRYLLISSSQPGGQPANLQGIWNNKVRPPWDSKYTININAEMNYWPAEKTNLSELHEPFPANGERPCGNRAKPPPGKCMVQGAGWHITILISGGLPVLLTVLFSVGSMGRMAFATFMGTLYVHRRQKILAEIYPVLKGAALFYAGF